MNRNFYLKTLRQRRVLNALLEKESIEVRDLGCIVGALNPRQVISELRRQGFEGIIQTQLFVVIDRDGNLCRPGKYFIPPEYKPIILEFLKKDGLPAALKRKKPQGSIQGCKQHDREGA